MVDKKSVAVTIFGHQYRLRGPQEKEHILQLAEELDKQMRDIAEASPKLSTHQVAVLAALRILAELNELKSEYAKGFQLALFNSRSDSDAREPDEQQINS